MMEIDRLGPTGPAAAGVPLAQRQAARSAEGVSDVASVGKATEPADELQADSAEGIAAAEQHPHGGDGRRSVANRPRDGGRANGGDDDMESEARRGGDVDPSGGRLDVCG